MIFAQCKNNIFYFEYKHVNSGNGIFEVRSTRPNQGLHKGDKIRVKEYNRVNKK